MVKLIKKAAVCMAAFAVAAAGIFAGNAADVKAAEPVDTTLHISVNGAPEGTDQIAINMWGGACVFCQVLFPEKSVGIPFFQQGIFPAFSGHYASLRMRACSIR